ncbi:MAG: hypothetical protein FVQ80_16985 [Planctomycetes bacterium]|nr:hypothetical protein [Planctomycetota bacterium]
MKGLKTNIKRPWIHYIIIIAYITAPLANILLLVLIAKLPLATIVHRLFKGYGLLAGLWLLTAPLVGIGLYFIHRISWYIFLGHSSLILIDYILKWAIKPVFYWRTVPTFHQFLLLTGKQTGAHPASHHFERQVQEHKRFIHGRVLCLGT